MNRKQLSFLPNPKIEYGGKTPSGRRKIQRPFHPSLPLHVTMRSSRARGSRNLLRHKWTVHRILQNTSKRHGIRVYRFANVGNHLHLLIQAKNREALRAFLREFSGVVAATITGATKGRPEKFWDGLAWSKIVNWGRQFQNTMSYVLLNVLESAGKRDRTLLSRLERDGVIILGATRGVSTPPS